MQNVSAESINVLGSTTNNSDLRLNDFGWHSTKRSCLFLARQTPQWAGASSFTRFLYHT
jgi:hypothetical protein